MKENEGQEENNTHNSTPIIDDVKVVCAVEGIKAPHATNTPTNIACEMCYSFSHFMSLAVENAPISLKPPSPDERWYKDLLSERDAKILEHSGKMVLLFEILRMAEELEDKVYVCFLIWSRFKQVICQRLMS